MSAATMWRAGEQRGDRLLAAFLLVVSAVLALSMHFKDAAQSAGSLDLQAGIGQFAALFLAFRYAFSGGRVWMLIVDAKRALLPVLPGRCLRVEILKAIAFALLPSLPFALVGAFPAAKMVFAASLTGISVGFLFSTLPYRSTFALVFGVLALQIGNQAGLLAWTPSSALVAAAALFVCCAAYVGWRIAKMALAPQDARVGRDYSMMVAIGRHAGSIWSAPNTAPMGAMALADVAGKTQRSPIALLGEPLARRLAEPGRATRDWALALGLFPLLMSGFFVTLVAVDGASMAAMQRVFLLVWPGLVLTWVPFGAVAFLWLGTFRPVRQHLAPGHPVHDALHLLPGMPVGRKAWRQRLLPVTFPPLAVGLVLVLSAMPMLPAGPLLVVPVIAAALMAVLVLLQPRLTVSTDPSAPLWGYVGAGLSGPLLFVLSLLTGISSLHAVLPGG
jgi:hypothetical protein